MLDYFCVFTKGGTLLWALSFVGSLKGDPINTLIRACLLEERAAQSRCVRARRFTPLRAAAPSLNAVHCRCSGRCQEVGEGAPAQCALAGVPARAAPSAPVARTRRARTFRVLPAALC